MKIAFLSKAIALGGASKSLFLLIKAIKLKNPDWQIYLFINSCSNEKLKIEFENFVESIDFANIPEYSSAQSQSKHQSLNSVGYESVDLVNINRFAERIKTLGINVLHINQSIFSFVYRTIADKTNVKVITHVREWIHWNGIHEKQSFIINEISRYSDVIICISNTEAEVFQNHDNMHIIANPFEFDELCNIEYTNKIAAKGIIIGNMASFTKTRGVIEYSKAINYIEKQYDDLPDRTYVFIGALKFNVLLSLKSILLLLNGKKTVYFEVYKNILWLYFKKRVVIIPHRKDALNYVKSFDIAVRSSSRNDPWGRNIIEYMALKKPVIATGKSEFFIDDNNTGFLIRSGDFRDLGDKIVFLLRNQDKIEKMGELGYSKIYSMCNMSVFGENIAIAYNSLDRN